MTDNVTLDNIISEAYEIKATLKKKFYGSEFYEVEDTTKYAQWKYKTVRFLSLNFEGDRVCDDYSKTVNNFDRLDLGTPAKFDLIIGVLESCKSIPEKVKIRINNDKNNSINPPNVVINNTNNLSQEQIQWQTQSIETFIEIIKDDLTGNQLKELKQIVVNEGNDLQKAKPKLLEKIKSFGLDVVCNIIANIITNSSIWSKL